jgi:hypothetical protein
MVFSTHIETHVAFYVTPNPFLETKIYGVQYSHRDIDVAVKAGIHFRLRCCRFCVYYAVRTEKAITIHTVKYTNH